MNDWQKEQQEKQNQLQILTHAIAHQLGEPWKAGADEHQRDEIHNGQGAKLYLSFSNNGHDGSRVAIRAGMNIGRNGAYETVYDPATREKLSPPFITVAISRGVETIAKEIRRRVIPEYLRMFEIGTGQVQRQNYMTAKRQANIRTLAAATGAPVPDFKQNPDTDRFYVGKRYGIVVVHYDGRAAFEHLDVTMEEAEYILRYLKGGEKP